MLKSLVSLGISTSIKAASSILIFIYAAHKWDAFSFGKFMYLFSVASLITLIAEFGFGHQILREVNSVNAREKIAQYLGCKLWLTLASFAAALVFMWWALDFSSQESLIFGLLLMSLTATSYSDMVSVTLRALQKIRKDFYTSSFTNVFVLIVCFTSLATGGDSIALAFALVAARIVQLLCMFSLSFNVLDLLKRSLAYAKPRPAAATFRNGAAFAVDAVTSAALINIDTVMLARLAGFSQTGVYQAAARFSQGVGLAFSILIGFFLPRMMAEPQEDAKIRLTRQLGLASLGVWACIMAAFLLIALAYRHQPSESTLYKAAPFLVGLGMVAALRMFSGWLSILLTEQGRQNEKALLYILTLLVVIGSSLLLVPQRGAWGMVLSYVLAYSCLTLLLIFSTRSVLTEMGLLMRTTLIAFGTIFVVGVVTCHLAKV